MVFIGNRVLRSLRFCFAVKLWFFLASGVSKLSIKIELVGHRSYFCMCAPTKLWKADSRSWKMFPSLDCLDISGCASN
jgi:hypothetical protein